MIKNTYILAMVGALIGGCSVGNMPEGMSNKDIKQTMDKMTPQQRIEFVQNSPASSEEKAKQIAEIKAKYGLK